MAGGTDFFTGWKDQKRRWAEVNRSFTVSAAKTPAMMKRIPNNTVRRIHYEFAPSREDTVGDELSRTVRILLLSN